jgi:cytosine/adenosine deaminase-related metal-dependent hydrolase
MATPVSCTLTARWVFPVSGPPIEGGAITVEGPCITAVEPPGVRAADLDLGDCAVIPGLVNAHTHLDLTGLRGRVPFTGDFTAWLRAVIRHRQTRSAQQVEADIGAGLRASVRFGVTLLADISAGGASWRALADAPIHSVVFRELLGLLADRARQAAKDAHAWLIEHADSAAPFAGLSPHAPYSVRRELFIGSGWLARTHRVPLSVHLAETTAELELLQRHTGPFVPFLRELGVWDRDRLMGSVQSVIDTLDQPVPLLLVHGNYLPPSTRIPRHATVVYCPRTHAYFGHEPHPFRDFLARGVRVALGTDSLASNPDLDLLAEARFLHACYPDVPGATLLHMATLAGAEALGLDEVTGSLQPGKSADLVVLPLEEGVAQSGDPHSLVLGSERLPVRVMSRGRWVVS